MPREGFRLEVAQYIAVNTTYATTAHRNVTTTLAV